MFTHRWPYQDMHELNLDWLLSKMKDLEKEVNELKKQTGSSTEHIEEQITNIDNSMIIINQNIQNLYNIVGMFMDTVQIKNAKRFAISDSFSLVDIRNI